MAIERWRKPSSMIEETERLMDELMSDFPLTMRSWRRAPAAEMGWTPAVEVYEKGDSFMIRAELPGVSKEDIDVTITSDILRISGERKAPEDVEVEDYYRCEVCYGPFSRSVSLPTSVDASQAEARFENGILHIRLPKSKEAMPSKIEIKS